MTKHVYVGNLPPAATSETLRSAFEKHGRSVASVALVVNSKTGKPRGFGFVEMATEDEAVAVINELDGMLMDGRAIKVGEGKARPEISLRPERFSGRMGGGRRRR